MSRYPEHNMSDAECRHTPTELDEKLEKYEQYLNGIEEDKTDNFVKDVQLVLCKCSDFTINNDEYMSLNEDLYKFFIQCFASLLRANHDADDLKDFFYDLLFDDLSEFEDEHEYNINYFSTYKVYSEFLYIKYYKSKEKAA